MDSYNVACPNCGKNVTLTEEISQTYCPYCGTKFNVAHTRSSGRSDSVLLYEATQTVNQILKGVDKYHSDSLALYEATHKNISNPFKRLLAGTDPYAMSDIHNNYFVMLDRLVNELNESLMEIRDTAAKSDLAQKACMAILEPAKKGTAFQVVFNYEADDILSQVLLQHMTEDALRTVYESFATPERRKFFYPNQKKLAEMMEVRLGIKRPKGLQALFSGFSKK